MPTKRIKAISLNSRKEFEQAIDYLAVLTVELRAVEARRDAQLQTVRAEFEPICNEISTRLQGLALALEKYAEDNRDELLPGKIKTAETPLAFFGFRLGQPTLKLINRSWSWEKVITAIKSRSAALAPLIRSKEEVDKDAAKKLPAVILTEIGLRVDQAESFFVEPKEKETALAG